ncbi:hypothetical protein PQR67_08245 [Paraburkholderia fungorum]|uniref:hypothetical protein n=1 Tax=Paraburkholderia fungorum TaxID=134537 RepID=UPI0038B99F75
MTDVRQLEFSFYRDGNIFGKSRFAAAAGKPGVTMNSTSSVSSFPFTTLETTEPDINMHMMNFGRGDILEVSTAENEASPLQSIFKGEFLGKKISMDNSTQTMTISSELVHSFYMLTSIDFAGENYFDDIPVKSFFEKIIVDSNCKASLCVSEEAGSIGISGRTRRGNLFRIIKEICHINDLVLFFGVDNSVRVERKSEVLMRIKGAIPVQINADEVLSYEATEGVPFGSRPL